jgi:hypothetical protein
MDGKRNRSIRCFFSGVVSLLARGYMHLRTYATWSTSTVQVVPSMNGVEVDATSLVNTDQSVTETAAATELEYSLVIEAAAEDVGTDKATHSGLYQVVLGELIDAKPKLNEVDLDFVLWLRFADL